MNISKILKNSLQMQEGLGKMILPILLPISLAKKNLHHFYQNSTTHYGELPAFIMDITMEYVTTSSGAKKIAPHGINHF